jgi:hypothetical protein
VAGGGAGGDAPDAQASALGLLYGQPQPPTRLSPSWDTTNHGGVQREVSNLLILFDTRPIARSFEYRLRGWARTLYCYCDTARRLPQIVQRVREEDDSVDEPEIGRKLNEWIDACIMVCIDGAYLSLALVLDRSCRISHASR